MSVIYDVLNEYFHRHPLPRKSVIGVAVSGGADSLCLAYALAYFSKRMGLILKAVTVNHGLRPEAETEAKYVHNLMTEINIPHETLVWQGQKPKTRVEEKARQKRYQMMEKWCQENNITHLFLAHHLGDQAETFWARLARGSGLTGLSAMGEYTQLDTLFLCRPFLNLPKEKLKQYLNRHKIKWCEDSMNTDESFERVRWRHRQKTLSDWGLTTDKVGLSCRRLTRAEKALSFYTDRFYNALADLSPMGYFTVQEQAFATLPDEIKLRIINKILNHLSPTVTPISLEALERWLYQYPQSATLKGCVLVRMRGVLFIAREARHLTPSIQVKPDQVTKWNDFLVLSSSSVQMVLGSDDKNLPYAIRKTVPTVRSNTDMRISFMIGSKKELEKKFNLDYKKKNSEIILLSFKGKNER